MRKSTASRLVAALERRGLVEQERDRGRYRLGVGMLHLAGDQDTNKALYRAYLLKEQLRAVFAADCQHCRALLAGWLSWARRSRLPAFVKLAKTIAMRTRGGL